MYLLFVNVTVLTPLHMPCNAAILQFAVASAAVLLVSTATVAQDSNWIIELLAMPGSGERIQMTRFPWSAPIALHQPSVDICNEGALVNSRHQHHTLIISIPGTHTKETSRDLPTRHRMPLPQITSCQSQQDACVKKPPVSPVSPPAGYGA